MSAILPLVSVVYTVDGGRIGSLEDFWLVMGDAVNGPGGYFNQNLDAVRQLKLRLADWHPSNRPYVQADLEGARAGQGPTVFDWLVGIFEAQVPGRLRLG